MDYREYFKKAKKAAAAINAVSEETILQVLLDFALLLEENMHALAEANATDLEKMAPDSPNYDRLKLTPERIKAMAQDIRNVAALESPLHRVLSEKQLPNGLQISKISVPLGVIGIIYEARPNVTADVFSLCFKTGNICLLKGGRDAAASNTAILQLIHTALEKNGVSTDTTQLLPPERAAADALMQATGYVDVIIPRGSQGLINHVRAQSRVPVIETGAGIVHTYFDKEGDLLKGKEIIANAKTRRVSVCNALDCLLVHRDRLHDLPELCTLLSEKQVEIFADEESHAALKQQYPGELLFMAEREHFGTEFLSLKMAIKTVGSLEEALAHIAEFSSHHSEAILTENAATALRFIRQVDAAAVYANASTAFTDGAQFGLGAEIGISTQKLHARGPMGLEELTSYKWVIMGNGQIRNS